MRAPLVLALTLCAAGPLNAQEPAPAPAPDGKVERLEKELAVLRRQIADLQAQLTLSNKRLDEQASQLKRLEEALARQTPGKTTTDDEARRYKAAVRITVGRKLEDYPKAVELLKGIPETSELHADAQAVLAWIRADLQVRKAQEVYDEGKADQALALLEKVLQLQVLGPNARDGVRLRRQRIAQVVRCYEKASELQKRGDAPAARRAYAEVLALEPNGMNFFRSHARRELAQLLAAVSGEVLSKCEAVAKAGDAAKKENARATVEILLEGLGEKHPHRERAEELLKALRPEPPSQN
jgi:tetratricopeptide (TPR) repeat protein